MFSSVHSRRSRMLAGAAAVAMLGVSAPSFGKPKPPPPPPPPVSPQPVALNNQLFSWFETGNTPPSNPAYVGTPFLTNSNATTVNSYFNSLAPGAIRAVKVESALTPANAALIFNNTSYHVSYVFGDLEGTGAATAAAALAKQVRYVNNDPAQKTRSSNAYIGNFGFSSQLSNQQAPANYSNQGQHSFSGYSQVQYGFAQLNMSNEEAYPGSPSFRNKAAGDMPSGGGTYPNIRSSLFVLPVWRVSSVEASQQSMGQNGTHLNIPWTANFNNWGNLGLDSDRNAANGYRFNAGQPMQAATIGGKSYPAMSVAQTTDQLLSRRDFANMVTHMRLRGADSVHLLESGFSGATNDQMEDDAAVGWNGEFSLNQIFAQSDRALLVGQEMDNGDYVQGGKYGDNTTIVVDGVKKNVDQAGALFSGAYSLDLGKLDVLISNMDQDSHTITLPSKIGNYALQQTDFVVGGGDHWMVEYSLTGSGNKKGWQVASQHVPYTAIANSRGGFGIPEPGTLSLLAVAAVLGLNRRKRDEKASA